MYSTDPVNNVSYPTENQTDTSSGYPNFNTGEAIFLASTFGLLVLVAVIGNSVLCILLRFRYMRCARYIRWCYLSTQRHGRDKLSVTLRHGQRQKDLWADDTPTIPHECSCGKPSTSPSHLRTEPYVMVFSSKKSTSKIMLNSVTRNSNSTDSRRFDWNDTQIRRSSEKRSDIGGGGGGLHPSNQNTMDHLQHYKQQKQHTQQQGSSITSLFLFNLSLADFLMAVLCIPTYIVTEIIYLYWPFGESMCKLVSYAQGISVFVSALTHVLISIDRFNLVYHPLRPRMSHRKAVGLLLGVWTLACIIPLPIPIVNKTLHTQGQWHCVEDWSRLFPSLSRRNLNSTDTDMPSISSSRMLIIHVFGHSLTVEVSSAYTVILMILQYFLPLGVICGTYAAIAVRVKRMRTPGERDWTRDQKLSRARRKMVRMLTTVAVMYGLSQLPRHTLYLHGSIHRDFWAHSWSVRLWAAATFARDSSTCYNLFIYAWINKAFRRDLYRLFRPSSCRHRMAHLRQSLCCSNGACRGQSSPVGCESSQCAHMALTSTSQATDVIQNNCQDDGTQLMPSKVTFVDHSETPLESRIGSITKTQI